MSRSGPAPPADLDELLAEELHRAAAKGAEAELLRRAAEEFARQAAEEFARQAEAARRLAAELGLGEEGDG